MPLSEISICRLCTHTRNGAGFPKFLTLNPSTQKRFIPRFQGLLTKLVHLVCGVPGIYICNRRRPRGRRGSLKKTNDHVKQHATHLAWGLIPPLLTQGGSQARPLAFFPLRKYTPNNRQRDKNEPSCSLPYRPRGVRVDHSQGIKRQGETCYYVVCDEGQTNGSRSSELTWSSEVGHHLLQIDWSGMFGRRFQHRKRTHFCMLGSDALLYVQKRETLPRRIP